MSREASHQRAGSATEDLHQEISCLQEQVFQELDGVRSKVAKSNLKPIKIKTVAGPQ